MVSKRLIVVTLSLASLLALLSSGSFFGGSGGSGPEPMLSTSIRFPKSGATRNVNDDRREDDSIARSVPTKSVDSLFSEVRTTETPQQQVNAASPLATSHQPDQFSEKDFFLSVLEMASLPHPSCLAEELLRKRGGKWKDEKFHRDTNPSKERGTVASEVNLEKSFSKKGWNCYKHGGHYEPGYDRYKGTFFTFNNVTYSDGLFSGIASQRASASDASKSDFFLPFTSLDTTREGGVASKKLISHPKVLGGSLGNRQRVVENFKFSGYFSMVSGNWPQLVTDTFPIAIVDNKQSSGGQKSFPSSGLFGGGTTGGAELDEEFLVDVAYFQPPTDYQSHYHVVVEVVATTFHRLWREELLPFYTEFSEDKLSVRIRKRRTRSEMMTAPTTTTTNHESRRRNFLMITSRPLFSRYGFKPKSCNEKREKCLDTHWGRMMTAMLSPLPSTPSGDEDGKKHILGLADEDPQLNWVVDDKLKMVSTTSGSKSSGSRKNGPNTNKKKRYRIGKLHVGNPTNCEPLWGPDPFYVEVAGATVKNSETYLECQRVLFDFRVFYLSWAFSSAAASPEDSPSAHHQQIRQGREDFVDKPIDLTKDPIEVVYVSRRGDWARDLLNEEKLITGLRHHLKKKYSDSLAPDEPSGGLQQGLRVIRFTNGTLEQQIQRIHRTTTIYITNHGANIIPSLYMRQNAGLILLSMKFPGFYPFGVFPRWQHVKDVTIEQDCNRRLNKGKCKWSADPNPNDNLILPEQVDMTLAFVDEIIDAQQNKPRVRGPFTTD